MALKPGTKAYNDWRRKNFNLNIKVPQSAIDKLMAGKTPSNNIKKYAGTDSKVMREAMNRFYGKGWEKKAPGYKPSGTPGKPSTPTTPPRNVPSSITGGRTAPRNAMNPKMLEGRSVSKASSGSKGNKNKSAAQVMKNIAPKTKVKPISVGGFTPSFKKTKPISVGGFTPGKNKVPKGAFSYKDLKPADKAALELGLSLMLPTGIGLGVKAIGALKAGMNAQTAAKALMLGREAAAAGKVAKTAKTAKAAKTAKTAKTPKTPVAPKTPKPANKTAKSAKAKPEVKPEAPKAKRGRPNTSGGNNPYGMRDYSDSEIIGKALRGPKNSRAWKEAKRRGLGAQLQPPSVQKELAKRAADRAAKKTTSSTAKKTASSTKRTKASERDEPLSVFGDNEFILSPGGVLSKAEPLVQKNAIANFQKMFKAAKSEAAKKAVVADAKAAGLTLVTK